MAEAFSTTTSSASASAKSGGKALAVATWVRRLCHFTSSHRIDRPVPNPIQLNPQPNPTPNPQGFGRIAVDKAREALERGGSALVRACVRGSA